MPGVITRSLRKSHGIRQQRVRLNLRKILPELQRELASASKSENDSESPVRMTPSKDPTDRYTEKESGGLNGPPVSPTPNGHSKPNGENDSESLSPAQPWCPKCGYNRAQSHITNQTICPKCWVDLITTSPPKEAAVVAGA